MKTNTIASFVAANPIAEPELVDIHRTQLSVARTGRDGDVNHFMVTVTVI